MKNAYQIRRQKLHGDQTLAIGATEAVHISYGGKAFHSNLFYLTGIEARAVVVIHKNEEFLFLPTMTEREKIFDGSPETDSEIQTRTGIANVIRVDFEKGDEEIRKYLNADFKLNDESAKSKIAELRWIKDADEQSKMRKAAHISRRAHDKAKAMLKDGLTEWELKVEFERELFLNGSREVAYSTISAAGVHATVLHWIQHDGKMHNGDLFLIDGAGKFENYCADITSTWSVGQQTDEQHQIMHIVQTAQDEAMKLVRPGNTMNEVHQRSKDVMADLLHKAKIIDDLKEIDDLYPHRASHWLGLDVHDPKMSAKDGDLKLQAGVTMTLEPGLYFRPQLTKNYGKYQKIGVRFEEDLLVTANGCEVLSRIETRPTP